MSAANRMASPLPLGAVVPEVALVDHLGSEWLFSDHRGRALLLILHRHLA